MESASYYTAVWMFQGQWSFIGLDFGVVALAARYPVGGGVVINVRPLFGPAQRATSWLSGTEIHSAPTAAFNISDLVDTIG